MLTIGTNMENIDRVIMVSHRAVLIFQTILIYKPSIVVDIYRHHKCPPATLMRPRGQTCNATDHK